MWSIIGTSSIPCAASRWRCSIWPIVSSSSHAVPINAPSKHCWPVTARSRRAARSSDCWRSLMIVPAKPSSLGLSMPSSMPEDCPISKRSADASRLIQPPFPTSLSRRRRCIFMTSSALSSWLMQHENDRSRRRGPHRAAPRRAAAARHKTGVGFACRSSRQGRLAGRTLLSSIGRTRDCRAQPTPARTPPRRSPVAPGKTLDSFDFEAVPVISKAQVMALAAGDAWLNNGANLLLFGPPGGGKSHLAAALGIALVENGWRVLFTRTTDLVQRLQMARRELALEAAIAKLDKYHLLILDDLAYVTKDQAETSVLFELISARYERRSLLITANQPFGEWGKIFPDQAMTLAVVDRLVHHATIFEMNVESYRRRAALERKRGPGRPPVRATIAANA